MTKTSELKYQTAMNSGPFKTTVPNTKGFEYNNSENNERTSTC